MAKATYPINLPPRAAIEYFQKKKNAPSWNWWDTWQDAHVRAFVVAKVTKLDILKDIWDMVEKSIKDGIAFQQFKKELQPKLEDAKWWGKKTIQGKEVQLGSPQRLKTIYQTNLKVAYSVGRYKAMMDNVANRPYWKYRTRQDLKVREEHRLLDGKVFPYNDKFWQYFYPPNGWRCRCYVVAMSKEDLKKEGRTPEPSKGNIDFKNVLLSKQSGIEKPVAVYKDPATGKKTILTPGWSYNPGEATWKPDLKKYPNELIIWFNKDGSYCLNPKEKEKIDNHMEYIRNTFKEWNNWEVKAKGNYDLTDEEFYKITKRKPEERVIGAQKGDNIYIKTNITLNTLGLSSRKDQILGELAFTHESMHSIKKYNSYKEVMLNSSKKEEIRVRKIEDGAAELLTRLWGVKYGKLKPEDIASGHQQKPVVDLALHLINKIQNKGIGRGNIRDEIINELYKTRGMNAEEMKEWSSGIDGIEDYGEFLPLLKNYGIITKDKDFNAETVVLWLLK